MCYQLLFGSATACQLCRWPFRNFPLRVPSFVLVADGAWFLQNMLEAKEKYVFITAQTIFILCSDNVKEHEIICFTIK